MALPLPAAGRGVVHRAAGVTHLPVIVVVSRAGLPKANVVLHFHPRRSVIILLVALRMAIVSAAVVSAAPVCQGVLALKRAMVKVVVSTLLLAPPILPLLEVVVAVVAVVVAMVAVVVQLVHNPRVIHLVILRSAKILWRSSNLTVQVSR